MKSISKRVKKGARLLDRKMPYWFLMIDVDLLNIWSSSDCILGQVYGEYYLGRMKCHLKADECISHGFVPQRFADEREFLEAEWCAQVSHRKSGYLPAVSKPTFIERLGDYWREHVRDRSKG